MWPRAASGRMRSQTILVVARIGAERIAPGTPHSQNQNTKEKTTRTGLSVNRLARSIGVTVSPSITWMAQGRLHQKIEHDREGHRQNNLTGHIGRSQHRKNKNTTEKECLCIGR